MNGTFWTTVMHTFEGFRQKFAHWSEWIHITPQSSFCNFLTSNPEVSGGHSVVVFNDFAQNTPKSARISSSYSIETNIPIGKHTLHSFKSCFQLFVWKCLLGCYIYAVYHHFLHFQPLLRINTCERNVLDYCHAHI